MKIILTNYSFLGITDPLVSKVVKDTVVQNVRLPILKVKRNIANTLEDIANDMGMNSGTTQPINSENKKTYSQAISEGIQKKVFNGERIGNTIKHKYTL